MPDKNLLFSRIFLSAAALGCFFFSACGWIAFQVGDPPASSSAAPSPAARPAKAERKAAKPRNEEDAVREVLSFVETERTSYKIGAADMLEITVYQEQDLTRKVRVSPKGIITFPLAGKIKVSGLSVVDAEEALTKKLKRYVIDPQVSIFILEYGNKKVYVLGEVKNPGSYPLPTEAPMTVIEAVTLAGGFTQYSAIDRTRVIRKRGGKTQTFFIPVSDIMKGTSQGQDLKLLPNDVIFVPESFF